MYENDVFHVPPLLLSWQHLLPSLPLARAEAAYVSEAVLAGVMTGIMQPCARSDLICVLPLRGDLSRASQGRFI